MSILNKLIYRLRLKLKDTDMLAYSQYEVLDAMNESLRELRYVVTKFYDKLNFIIPVAGDLAETSDTGWPGEFDEILIEYALILLSTADYGTKEQLKMLWQQKVLSLAGTMNTGIDMIRGYFGGYANDADFNDG